MRKIIAALVLLAAPGAFAAGSEVALLDAKVDLGNQASLQRGAKLFVNYCLSCHAASFMRYDRMARDLGLTETQLKENLMFAAHKAGDKMTVAMSAGDAERWFGSAPPDLSVIARYRGANWLFTYLMSFYEDPDPSRPFGVNNLVFKDVAMPHVMADLQGVQVRREATGHDAHARPRVGDLLALATPGKLNPAQYSRAARDLVNFLVYLGEPAKLVRYRVGAWVLLFLAIFFFLARALYKEYWKDIQ